jgi:hypothetical protein
MASRTIGSLTLADAKRVIGAARATALLDRLLLHAVVVQIEGLSYRMRQHAALLPPAPRPSIAAGLADLAPPRRRGRPPKAANA